ncbi:TonB-dependent receptor [Maribellus maritimus]|uniref:TonB-dependent receptor n=1 Tax=Maribellus maritimus TaxID=2870838 RepID=UPI001EEB61E3|nr:TonB-dependent receptor [Maribellus maritimus]MCG6190665.1 TonB-dependent receptor [Maribellus maritimus]
MKLTITIILLALIHVNASVYSQTKLLNLKIEKTSIESALKEIENQSEFFFLYNTQQIDVTKKVDIDATDKTIEDVLETMLKETDIHYLIKDRQIVLYNGDVNSLINAIGKSEIIGQQQNSVTGTVTDDLGQPLPGVTVRVKGTSLGTVTDADGYYTISNVKPEDILAFSFVGMKTKEIEIGNQATINTALELDAIGIEEVVAIGYGTQKKVNVIGSVTSVSEEELTSSPVSRISNALAGRLPGGIFMQDSGEPGNDAATIKIRGNSTLGDNTPLVVIDGIPDRDLNSLHPEDIESVTVLKDASAGIYGARAANGVILITTKKGEMNKPPKFVYNFFEGFLSPTKLPEMADAATYAMMIRENQSYRNVDESNMMYSLEDVAKFESGEYPWTHPNTDWFGKALKNHSTTRHHGMSVSGGTKNISYYSSFGTQQDNGIYTNSATSYKRYNLKVNLDIKINDYLNVGINMAGVQENRMFPTTSASDIFSTLVRMYPTQHALFPNGLPGPDLENGDQPMVSASSETGYDDDRRYRSNNILSANLKIPWVKGLTLSGYYAYDKYVQKRKLFQKPWTLYSLDESSYLTAGNTGKEDGSAFLIGTTKGYPEPRVTNYSDHSESKTANIKLDYVKTINNNHNISAFISYEQNEYDLNGFSAFRRYYLSDKLPYLFAGGDAEKDNDEWVELDSRMNYFGRFSYNYKEKYLFQFSFRRDGSLRFSKEAGRWGNFPSVLVGWRLSEENWWQNKLGFIDQFKLKASWGQMGNDLVDAFQYLASYGVTTGAVLGTDKEYYSGLIQSNIPNPNITWEVANVFNFGWESIFLDNKMSFDVDFFYERRNNILVERNASVPEFTGLELPDENFGIVDNRGFEVLLGYYNNIGELKYKVSGNLAFARNKIVEYDEPERNVPWQVMTGSPQGTHLLYRSMGIFRDWEQVNSMPHVTGARPGDIIIQDYDDDGEITNDDRQLFPLTTTPELTFGASFNLQYKNWELSGLLQGHGRALREIYTDERIGTGGNYFQYDAEDRWTPDNIDATKPRAYERVEEYWRSSYVTDYNFANVSYLRLKNLQLNYNIPSDLVRSLKIISGAKIYLSGQNLWLIYAGNEIMDPEVSGMSSYPIMKVMSVGAQVTF